MTNFASDLLDPLVVVTSSMVLFIRPKLLWALEFHVSRLEKFFPESAGEKLFQSVAQ